MPKYFAKIAPARTWNSVYLRQHNGNPITMHAAISEMYQRQQRIEAKLERLLGAEDVRPPANAPDTITYRVALPVTPHGVPAQAATELTLPVDFHMFVPKVIAKKGLVGYEPGCFPQFLAALQHAPQGEVFDVGSNIGPYGLLARLFSDRVVRGFEPAPDLARVARACGEANSVPYEVSEIAFGDTNGWATLYLSDSTDSSNSLNRSFRSNSYVLKVPVETVDHYVERIGTNVGLIKIDTESTEPAVIRGAKSTIVSMRPWLLVEVLTDECGEQIMAELAGTGYRYHHVTGSGQLAEMDKISGDPISNFMWLLTPEEVPSTHWALSQSWFEQLEAASTNSKVHN